MTIHDIEAKFNFWDSNLSLDKKKYIHYNSMRNFLYNYNNINDRKKERVLDLFENYITEIEKANFYFTKEESFELAKKYINKIADIFTGLGFKLNVKFGFVVWWGILSDILLLIIGILSHIKYFTHNHNSIVFYYMYLQLFKKPKKLVYGIFY